MARLIGGQRLVLQAILNLPKDDAGYVTDTQVAQNTQIALKDVRDWIETLEGQGFVEVVRATDGLRALITAEGRLALGLYQPFGTAASPASQSGPSPASPGSRTAQPPTNQPSQTQAPPCSPARAAPDNLASPVGPAPTMATGQPIKPMRLFYSYSHKDEALRDELEEALALLKRQSFIAAWHDRKIGAGEEWRNQLDKNLEEADVILLLISPPFLASDYCYDIETKRALERHDRGEAKVIPVLLRPVDWEGSPFARLQGLPIDLRPVTTWPNRDEAWKDVARGIRRAVEAMKVTLSQVRPFHDSASSTTPLPASPPSASPLLASPRSTSAAPTPGPQGTTHTESGSAIDSSGNWVMLGNRFFESRRVKHTGGVISVVIRSQGAEDDAAIQALGSSRSGDGSIAYAYRNDALIVDVQDVESESTDEGSDWTIKLEPKDLIYGGDHGEFGMVNVNGRQLSAEQIAEKRAGRILLNNPPPLAYDHRKHDTETMLELHIRGINVPKPVDRCPLRDLYAEYRDDPTLYLRLARLGAIYALKAGDVIETVEKLTLGPIQDRRVHVSFAGRRRKKYSNVAPQVIEIEGECPLT